MDENGEATAGLRLGLSTSADDVCVVLTGYLNARSVPFFLDRLDPLLAVDPKSVVVELRDLEHLDCAGAAALDRLSEDVEAHQGSVVLRNPTSSVGRVLDRCGLARRV